MATEIELKAHVTDSEAMRLTLSKKAEYLGAFEKEDTYWFPGGLRVRREKRTHPDGRMELLTLVSYKTKEVKDGIEVNDEREFEARPVGPHSESEFEEFLALIGLKPGIAKKKRGWVFSRDGITAELAEVEGLGYFVELEIVDNGANPAIEEGKKRLLDFLAVLGIQKEAIESRYYTEMLRERNMFQVCGNS